jgi:GT2 family glycosyltransferase
MPRVAIAIINWNDRENSSECLTSLRKIEYPNYEILLVDNGSTDGSRQYLGEQFPEAILLTNAENLGFTGGFNVAIKRALEDGAEYVLCLNNDTVLDRNFLTELTTAGERESAIGALCPLEYDYFRPTEIVYAGGRIGLVKGRNRGIGQIDHGQFASTVDTGMLCGAAMMIKSRALMNTGLFDPEFFFSWEDKDMAVRLTKNGYRIVFVPSARFWHKRRGATNRAVAPITVYFNLRNGLLFARKHYRRWRFGAFVPVFLLSSIFYSIGRSSNIRMSARSAVLALLWHVNRNRVPVDSRMVEILND